MNNKIPFTAPKFEESAFNCPYCIAFSNQNWHGLKTISGPYLHNTRVCYCSRCKQYSIWHEEIMIYPDFSGIEPPNEELDVDIKGDYQEAASISQKSPRGAAALLRLVIQKLCKQLGEKGKNINTDIGNLVKKGLPAKVQQSLDSLRVIGNEAVHPGQLDLKDDIKIASSLFKLVNFIAEKTITEPKEIGEIYDNIPDSKKKQIKKRDKK